MIVGGGSKGWNKGGIQARIANTLCSIDKNLPFLVGNELKIEMGITQL